MTTQPAIFFGHGNPMNAIQQNDWTDGWAAVGRSLSRPDAVLCVSAHWYVPTVAVTAMASPRTIHDFGGFPPELFAVRYPAAGAPHLAARVVDLLDDKVVMDTGRWGLDHGTWSVLCHVFPEADVPVVQLSIDKTQPASWHYELAKRLSPLRDENILVMGSGNLVHNLHAYAWGEKDLEPLDWAVRFEAAARELMVNAVHEPLIRYEAMGKDALLSAPTPDHYLPLLYVLAQQRDGDEVSFPVGGFDGGSISMTTVRVG
jgi:4,5-DOPA dioxygenase extradiol